LRNSSWNWTAPLPLGSGRAPGLLRLLRRLLLLLVALLSALLLLRLW